MLQYTTIHMFEWFHLHIKAPSVWGSGVPTVTMVTFRVVVICGLSFVGKKLVEGGLVGGETKSLAVIGCVDMAIGIVISGVVNTGGVVIGGRMAEVDGCAMDKI